MFFDALWLKGVSAPQIAKSLGFSTAYVFRRAARKRLPHRSAVLNIFQLHPELPERRGRKRLNPLTSSTGRRKSTRLLLSQVLPYSVAGQIEGNRASAVLVCDSISDDAIFAEQVMRNSAFLGTKAARFLQAALDGASQEEACEESDISPDEWRSIAPMLQEYARTMLARLQQGGRG